MKTEWLKTELELIIYKDETDAVALRYLLLQALACYATEYKSVAGTGYGLQLLQQYKKLEAAHAGFKQKCRNCEANGTHFMQVKSIALENVKQLISFKTVANAA